VYLVQAAVTPSAVTIAIRATVLIEFDLEAFRITNLIGQGPVEGEEVAPDTRE
jgi:hypothetical protein